MSRGSILVTGASGFTGRYFASFAAAQGYECIGLSHDGPTSIENYSKTITANILDKIELSKILADIQPDYVVHLAAVTFVGDNDVSKIYSTNVIGSANLLDAVIASVPNIQKILIASSGNIYGNATELPITEQTRAAPVNDYGVSKVAMELAANVRRDSLPIVITRPFNYTGVGQADHFLVPKIVKAYRSKQNILELGNLDVARDFSDVRDLARVYLQLLQSEGVDGTYNICSGIPVALKTIVGILDNLSGQKMEVVVNPAFVRANEIKELFGSNTRLIKAIGQYRNFAIEQTLDWMLHSTEPF